MKAILSLALALGFCGMINVAAAAEPAGTWTCEYEIAGQKRTSTLTIQQDGNKVAGTMSWPDQSATELKDVKLAGDVLTFSAVRKFMGNEFQVDYKLTLAGETFTGKGTSEFAGQKREWDIAGKKQK